MERVKIVVDGQEVDVEYEMYEGPIPPGVPADAVQFMVKIPNHREVEARLGPPTREKVEALMRAFGEQVVTPLMNRSGNA